MVTLEKIGRKNIWNVVKLAVNESQRDFVATNTESILEAYAASADGETALPFAVCEDGVPVGFVMIGYGSTDDGDDPSVAAGNYCIWRFMIDKRYQGRGLGRAGFAAAMAYVRTMPCGPAGICWLSYEPENSTARELYASFGFEENGETCGGETVAVLRL